MFKSNAKSEINVRPARSRLSAKTAALATVASILGVLGLAVVPSAGQASAASPYRSYSTSIYTNTPDFLGTVHIQAGWHANGQTVYLDYLYATPEGWGESVTWQGPPKGSGGGSNLTFGENDQWCIGGNFGCFTGGARVVVNTNGAIINYYQFGV